MKINGSKKRHITNGNRYVACSVARLPQNTSRACSLCGALFQQQQKRQLPITLYAIAQKVGGKNER